MNDMEPTLFDSYRDLYRPYVNSVNNRLAKHQLYTSQWVVLRLIKIRKSCTLAELAKETRVEKPSVTRIIQKLIELGYVEITAGDDKREKIVQLTLLGFEVYTSIEQELSTYLNELTEGINKADLRIARDVLSQILEKLLK
ncbi:MarR family winged helix-turn-helix transcriptional regulator [Lysinibacillus sp. SGAir0095]|uniref:MarR family winged helix-turn-helix transcriptional regulator n=1 Tax=Lysinibacillus sp. SGAir0095 TaxID=2070463 RepID=UPI0010CCD1DE|nr:MarR family transcriptional regulator [Lysinibacillus sp. SGAir0095]QCR30872.1 MarR family transcriptional regulator [Lysinibacillus sp. SGAir0095]